MIKKNKMYAFLKKSNKSYKSKILHTVDANRTRIFLIWDHEMCLGDLILLRKSQINKETRQDALKSKLGRLSPYFEDYVHKCTRGSSEALPAKLMFSANANACFHLWQSRSRKCTSVFVLVEIKTAFRPSKQK